MAKQARVSHHDKNLSYETNDIMDHGTNLLITQMRIKCIADQEEM